MKSIDLESGGLPLVKTIYFIHLRPAHILIKY
jgi:hypothetical protein